MYFPFLELQKWRKRSAEIRRRNCAVLPSYIRTPDSHSPPCSTPIIPGKLNIKGLHEKPALRVMEAPARDGYDIKHCFSS